MQNLTLAQAAKAAGVEQTTLKNWLLHSEFTFGSRTITGRWRFDAQDAFGIALAGELVKHGQRPRRALVEAARLVRRAGEHALVVCASTNPVTSAILVPDDPAITADAAQIVIPLPPLRAAVAARLPNRKEAANA